MSVMIGALRSGGKRVETLLHGRQGSHANSVKQCSGGRSGCLARLLKRSEVMPEILDVLVVQRARHACHAARVVGPRAILEVPELLDDVFVVLPGDARDLVLAGEAAQVAHGAERFVRLGLAARGASFVGLEAGGARLLGGEERREIEHIFPRQRCSHGRHLRVRAASLLEVAQLKVEVARGLSRQDRKQRHHRVAVGTVAGAAGLGLLAPGLDVLAAHHCRKDNQRKEKGRPEAAFISERLYQSVNEKTNTLLPRLKSICVLPPQPIATYCLPRTM